MTVSVCIPTYNQASFIEEAVKSAYSQTYSPFEIIVSNDASTDNTIEILERLKLEIPNLLVFNQTENLGISKNVDACLRIAKGDLVVRLDSDDILNTNFIATFVPLFQQFPNLGYGHAAVEEIDENGNKLKERRLNRKQGIQLSQEALEQAILGYKVAANIIIFRRESLEKVGYIQLATNFCEDYYLIASISKSGFDNFYYNTILSSYRIWLDKAKLRSKRKLSEIVGYRRIFEDILEPAFENTSINTKINRQRCKLAIRHSSCLSWDIYNRNEKKQIKNNLIKLSNNSLTKFFILMYSSNLEILPNTYFFLLETLKNFAKAIHLKFLK